MLLNASSASIVCDRGREESAWVVSSSSDGSVGRDVSGGVGRGGGAGVPRVSSGSGWYSSSSSIGNGNACT